MRRTRRSLEASERACHAVESRSIPAWVDESDPKSLLAWARTDRELTALEFDRSS